MYAETKLGVSQIDAKYDLGAMTCIVEGKGVESNTSFDKFPSAVCYNGDNMWLLPP